MYSGCMEMYGVPGRSVLRKKDARVRIPSLATLKSFILKAFFFFIHKFDFSEKNYFIR
jgi:hypothetical protein